MNKHAVPMFAMSFTQEAVFLERREGQDWQPLGQAEFARGNIAGQLGALRSDLAQDSSEPDTVLVIPDDQILYTTMTTSPGSDIPATIARALEGMTPYKADDLAFDWCPDADGRIDSLRVAAVARKTLQEAEEFARLQGFRPSGFVARPGDDRFEGDPDFGVSELARQEHDAIPFSKPELRNSGITSDRIAIAEPEETHPVISAIIPHYAFPVSAPVPAAEPIPVPISASPDEIEAEEPSAVPEPAQPAPKKDPPRVAAPVVIRHGEGHETPLAAGLSPRAQAFHEKAAEARSSRAKPEPEAAGKAIALLTRLQRAAPGNLAIMCGFLFVLLVAALLIFGGNSPEPDEVAGTPSQTDPAQTDPAQADPALAGSDEPTAQTATNSGETDPGADEPGLNGSAQQDLAGQNTVDSGEDIPIQEITPADTALSDSETAPESADPAATSDDPLTAALAEAMQGTPAAESLTSGADAETPETPSSDPSNSRVLQGEAAQIAAGQAVDRAVSPSASASTEPANQPQPSEQEAATTQAQQQRLERSVRPPRVSPQQTSQPATSDTRPSVPADPQPYEQRSEPEPVRVSGQRPPNRPAAAAPAPAQPEAAPAATTAPAESEAAPAANAQPAANTATGNSSRPPSRPADLTFLEEGSSSEEGTPTRLTRSERLFLEQLLRDLRTAQAGAPALSEAEHGAVIQLAQARPQRRPVEISGPSQDAVRAAVEEAISSSERPVSRSDTAGSPDVASAGNASDSPPSRVATASLGSSGRPMARPEALRAQNGNDPGSGDPSLARDAVEDAIAAAVQNSTASPGAVALTALTSSEIPPRRNDDAAPAGASDAAPADAGQEAAIAEQRRRDEELQAQAEARARERAAADAQAEAQARAAAEARARAQAEAEARAAAARNQRYVPPEAENEPEVAQPRSGGKTAASVAAAATTKGGIQINRTQIIGTVGAGKASRALVRLSNGKVITLRLGDKINGGQIVEIGDSRITYVEGGRSKQLSVLGGQ
ncbi:hypothetical protein [Paracoccus onubensis]|uniref:Type IV pilus biogenesis protein PilP n=1 Tax=Paracoccus onubensis TaxID=1675788 RepID=A0A418SS83_9RHOB|nr:hypothetical protein [Paracoccus onubensis]RJE83737.1 hypothetical protein D3P04_15170 [Paracoccus onubensis]